MRPPFAASAGVDAMIAVGDFLFGVFALVIRGDSGAGSGNNEE